MASLIRTQRTEANERRAINGTCEVESSHFDPLIDQAHAHVRGGSGRFWCSQARFREAFITPAALCPHSAECHESLLLDGKLRGCPGTLRSDRVFCFCH